MMEIKELVDEELINKICKGEEPYPQKLLGQHTIKQGQLVCMLYQELAKAEVCNKDTEETVEMKKYTDSCLYYYYFEENAGFNYYYRLTYNNGKVMETADPYSFQPTITNLDGFLYGQGTHYEIYSKLGAHMKTIKGVTGVCFAIWAPGAQSVSVIGDFNNWNGITHQLCKISDGGMYELFIPKVQKGSKYLFQIKTPTGDSVVKLDPYGNAVDTEESLVSVVTDIEEFRWTDKKWILTRKKSESYEKPMVIYEVDLSGFRRLKGNNNQCANYKELALGLCNYVKKMGYTHIELMNIQEELKDENNQSILAFYTPTKRFGTAEDFQYFINILHQNGIAVIMDWKGLWISDSQKGYGNFDGTKLFELDEEHREGLRFNYGRKEVKNFLISNVIFWIEKYHLDGIRIENVTDMLYSNYNKGRGHRLIEDSTAVDFIRHLNSVIVERNAGCISIANEETSWGGITASIENNGLGFKYKWNTGWVNDFLDYISKDIVHRQYEHWKLTFGLVYAFTEKHILGISHNEIMQDNGNLINRIPGNNQDKLANLRVAYGFMFGHPGKKLLFMGQDFAQETPYEKDEEINWQALENEENAKFNLYIKELINFYKNHIAFYELDHEGVGFEWMNCEDAINGVVSFVRKTRKGTESLLFVCNFSATSKKEFRVGIPNCGEYIEVFNSDEVKYGGTGGFHNERRTGEDIPWDNKAQSMEIDIPPLGLIIFSYEHMM